MTKLRLAKAVAMIEFKLQLARLGASVVTDDGVRIRVKCAPENREAVVQLMHDHGFVS